MMGERARELAGRQTGAVDVALLWHICTDDPFVFVHDANGGVDFLLYVDAAEVMEVFRHPYAYAASRGVEYSLHDDEMEVVDA